MPELKYLYRVLYIVFFKQIVDIIFTKPTIKIQIY
jgi:hypothetical protein